MPPTSNFGHDITNTSDSNNNREGGGNDSNGNHGNHGRDTTLTMIERMGGRMMLPKLAGRGVIRVVSRCEEAKENQKLG